jgi:hypothetical protein
MDSERSKVFIVKEQVRRDATGPVPMDYTPAFKYGDVEFITSFDLPLHQNGTLTGVWMKDVRKFLQRFDPENDWIVLTGSPLAIFIVGLLMGRSEKIPRILVWKREIDQYIPYTINWN